MKTLGVPSKIFALAVTAGLLSLSADIQAATASVVSVKGAVTGAAAGESVGAGAVISTQADSTVGLEIGPARVTIQEGSTLAINKFDSQQTGVEEVTEIEIDLQAGRITGDVGQLSSLSKMVVLLPKGQVVINANSGPVRFDISADGNIFIPRGSADVTFNRGTATAANIVSMNLNGMGFNPNTGATVPVPADVNAAIGRSVANFVPAVTVPAPPTQPFTFFISPNLNQTSSN